MVDRHQPLEEEMFFYRYERRILTARFSE